MMPSCSNTINDVISPHTTNIHNNVNVNFDMNSIQKDSYPKTTRQEHEDSMNVDENNSRSNQIDECYNRSNSVNRSGMSRNTSPQDKHNGYNDYSRNHSTDHGNHSGNNCEWVGGS